MSITSALMAAQQTATPLATLINSECHAIGGIFRLDYSSAVVLTDDFRKKQAGGVPHGGFLLAAAGTQTAEGFTLDDEELILLRVRGTASLPNEQDLVQTRLAVVRDATDSGMGFDDVTDELTRNELQQSAFDCEVIGTFYTDPGSRTVEYGSDIDNVVSSAKYQVFLPSKDVLSWLASYPEAGEADLLSLGVVRFSSTRRRARASGVDRAGVRVHIDDFVARKTAVFGMTRTGKSNTIKTLVTAIATHTAREGSPVGQLIFDPQGEYANVNAQDGTGLRLLGNEDHVRIYRLGADRSDEQVFPLAMNFFDPTVFEAVVDFVNAAVLDQYGTYAYVKSFSAIDWTEPDPAIEYGDYVTWTKAKLGFYGLLSVCGFNSTTFGDAPYVEFGWTDALYNQFNTANPGLVTKAGRNYRASTPAAARKVFLFMANEGSWNQRSDGSDTAFKLIADMNTRASGKAAIRQLTAFHSVHSSERVEQLVWADMEAGRISIVDLAHGSTDVSKVISENVVNYLLARANERFREGLEAVPFQIVVEEAHNLFERRADDKSVRGNPWVRLSKEAAKYRIGLIYATQEVSSVDQRILSNTSNWLVAHLNSDNETRELSHYYDFKTWAESIRRTEDQGFVRMKTYSGKYIIPVQVAKFDHAMINQARSAAGLDTITAGTE